MKNKRKKADWLTIIPILFWLSCMAFSLAKLYQSGNKIHIIDYIEIFNSSIIIVRVWKTKLRG